MSASFPYLKNVAIVYIITQLELGGAQKVCLSLFKDNSALLLAGGSGFLGAEAQKIGPTFFIPELKNTISPLYFFQDLKAFWQIYRQVKLSLNNNPKLIVHTHSSKAGLLGRWAAWFAGCKNIVHTVHGFGFNSEQFFLKFWLIWFLEFFTNLITKKLIFVSMQDLSYAKKFMWVPLEKSTLINACAGHIPATNLLRLQVIQAKVIRVGSVSCFKQQKNLFDLLKAFKIVIDRLNRKKSSIDLRLDLVGDGELRPKIEAWIKINNLSEKITLHGWKDNLLDFYPQIDIFALSSLWEGLPCAVVEAQLFKIPVIAYDVGGIKEVVASNVNGFLVSPKNVAGLANKLEILVCNHDLRHKMSSTIPNLDGFLPVNMLVAHKELYKNLIS